MAIIPRVEDLPLDVPANELVTYAEQKNSFQDISRLCARTISYEHKIKEILRLLPSEAMIKKFN